MDKSKVDYFELEWNVHFGFCTCLSTEVKLSLLLPIILANPQVAGVLNSQSMIFGVSTSKYGACLNQNHKMVTCGKSKIRLDTIISSKHAHKTEVDIVHKNLERASTY